MRFLQEILDIINDPKYTNHTRSYPADIKQFLYENIPWAISIGDARFCIQHKISKQPTCKTCKKLLTFNKSISAYNTHCGISCASKDSDRIKKIKETHLKNCGFETNLLLPDTIALRENRSKELFGTKNPFLSAELQKQLSQQCMNVHGVFNYGQTESAKETRKSTCLNRYGVENVTSLPSVIRKSAETKLIRYGCSTFNNHQQSIQTNLIRYGVEHPAQNTDIHSKSDKGRWYTMISPSGLEVKVQGYERFVLPILWERFSESDIIISRKCMPILWWLDNNNKKHRYYPDFYIPKLNLIIEVKSTYTAKYSEYKLKQITKTMQGLPYEFKVIIMKNKSDFNDPFFNQ